LQHKVLSKHKTFAAHFSLFSDTPVCRGTQFGKHWTREWLSKKQHSPEQ